MKKIILSSIVVLTTSAVFAQVAVKQGTEMTPPSSSFSTFSLVLMAIGGTAFIYLVIYSLSKAIEALSGRVAKKYEFPDREV